MKKLDYWIIGLLDYWAANSPGLEFRQSTYPSIQQSMDPAIRHPSFVIPFA